MNSYRTSVKTYLSALLDRWRWLCIHLDTKVHVASFSGPHTTLHSWLIRLPVYGCTAARPVCRAMLAVLRL